MAKEQGEVSLHNLGLMSHFMKPQDLQIEGCAPPACAVIPAGAGTGYPLQLDYINIASSELGEEMHPSHFIKSRYIWLWYIITH